ncbi:uncharacterized protein B0H18DRAFT_553516 [Fomitopsis serialis]|uniref:uncharacterized protein n=1 Tax=Fomitopsis serialis TaxID=139415 RepID=UPI002007FDB5|nr:uncharacterized protein B0H18DRAFT_553516 [Neoantrodia serialis]KAH9934307.1 hypothetical protein B0H18DRAFT_553516 [Neoantrodia serialis]
MCRFYARRVYILADRNWMLPLVIGILSCTRLLCAFITVQRLLVIKVIADLSQKIGALVGIGLGAGCLADWIILVALVFLLRRRRSGMKDTDSLIDKLIYWTVNNGLFTSILNVCVIVTLLGMPDNMIYFALDLLLSKLYANSLLATLNYRSVAHGRGTDDTEPAYPLSPLRAQQTGDTLRFNPTTTVAGVKPVVHVMTTTITDAPFSSQAMVCVLLGPTRTGSHTNVMECRRSTAGTNTQRAMVTVRCTLSAT